MINVLKNNLIEVSGECFDNLKKFCDLLLENNKKFNLTAIREESEVFEKHFADSLKGLEFFKERDKILEVGSGGGFPSVPLKIANPALDFTLLEATGKKCEFLKQVKTAFNFENFCVVNGRAEELAQKENYRESFNVVTARAVASLNVLCELCLPFLKVGGIAVFYKQKSEEELNEGKRAVKLLGGKIERIVDYTLYSNGENARSLIIIRKTEKTNKIYPREYKKILKTPL